MAIFHLEKSTGYCPTQDTEYTVTVKFTEVKTLGQKQTQYKKTPHYCEYADENECLHMHSGNPFCPIVMNAKF